MPISEIIALITAVLHFPEDVKWLIKLLQDTPEEKRDALRVKIKSEADSFSKTGRPS